MANASPGPAPAPREWWWVFDPRASLRARTALLAGGTALAFAALVTWIAVTAFRRELVRQVGGDFETLAFQLGDKIDRTVYERYRQLELVAALAPFRARDASTADRRQLLEDLQFGTRDFAWAGFVDENGEIVAATQRVLEGTSAANRDWFNAARQGPFVSGLRERPELGRGDDPDGGPRRYIDLAVPVIAPTGKFLGVVGAQVEWTWARDVQLSVVPEAMRRDQIGATIYAANREVLLDSGASGWTEPPGPPSPSETRQTRGWLIEPAKGGTTYLTGYAHSRGFREYRGVGWLSVVRQPLDGALAPLRDLRRTIVAWAAVFVVLLGAAAWIAAARMSRRLRTIGLAARRIHQGDVLATMPQPRGTAEIDEMSRAIGELVEELRPKIDPPAAPAPALAKPAFSPVERMRNSV